MSVAQCEDDFFHFSRYMSISNKFGKGLFPANLCIRLPRA